MKDQGESGKNKILDVMKRRGQKEREDSKVDELNEKLKDKDSPFSEPIIGESVCEYEGEFGKLYWSDIQLVFQGEQSKHTIPMKDIQSIKKDGRKKISIRTASGRFAFGPFHRSKRSHVFDALRAICKVEADGAPSPASSDSTTTTTSSTAKANKFPVDSLPGMKDAVLNDIFATPSPGVVADGTWLDPVAACTAGAGFIEPIANETYPIGLKPWFALFFSDSATLEKDFHTHDNDFDLKFTPWAEDASKAFWFREKTYSRKTKLYSCKVHQAQRVRYVSKTEIWFETTTGMTGLPLADTFNVDTRWRVVTTEDPKNGASTSLKIWCDIDFKKERMNLAIKAAKYKIERGAYDGTVEFYKNFFIFTRKLFTGEDTDAGPGEGGASPSSKGGSSSSSRGAGGVVSPAAKQNTQQVIMYLVISLGLLFVSCIILSYMLSGAQQETSGLVDTVEKLKRENERRMEGLEQVEVMANQFHEKYVHLTNAMLKTANKRWADVLFQTRTLLTEYQKYLRQK